MPTTYAIPDGRTVFAATTYTGTGAARSVSNSNNGVSFQPDFVWIKDRTAAQWNNLTDSVRGVGKELFSNAANAEETNNGISSLNSNGFSLINWDGANKASDAYVAWQWKAGGTAVSNTAGTITTTVSANATAGFSVITYSGNATDNATIGHGLSSAPQYLIWKPRNAATDWMVWHIGLSGYNYDVRLNTTAAEGTGANPLNNTAPGTSVITLRNQGDVNGSGKNIVCYAFAPVAGYSAFGKYTGNGSTDGPFIYTGFRPRFFMYKRTDSAGSWVILDSSRNPSNVTTQYLYPNASDAEASATFVDFVSNGIKFRTTYTDTNGSGATYLYACWAENPFKFSNAR